MHRFRAFFLLPFVVFVLAAAACGDDDASPADAPDAGASETGTTEAGIAPVINGPAQLPPLVMGTATVGSLTFTASGTPPVAWSSANLPPGMTFTASGGKGGGSFGNYAGTPTAPGDFTFTITATNAFGSDTRTYTQKVNPPALDGHVLLTQNRLAAFSTKLPSAVTTPSTLTGLTAGDNLVAIDRRPVNGFLYGLGFNPTNGTVTLYAVHPDTSSVVAVGGSQAFADGTGAALPVAGTYIGMDFNPVVDRIRVTTSTGQNFRMDPNTGAAVDADPNVSGNQMDGAISGGTSTVGEIAYTDNLVLTNTNTTLYTLDVATDKLYIQNPPNAGTQTSGVALAKTIDAVLGFDIPRGVFASTPNAPAAGKGFAVVKLTGQSSEVLAQIDLTTGAFTSETPIGAGNLGVLGLAIQETERVQVIGLTASGTDLMYFTNKTAPDVAKTKPLANLTAGEVLVGIDWRPATGQLFGFGVNATADSGTLYLIDPVTAVASVVGAPSSIAFTTAAAAPVDLPPITTGYGFDFNPQVDRVRVVSGSGLNFRLNPTNGTAVDGDTNAAGTQPDGTLNGPSSTLEAVAYSNGAGAMATTLYGLSAATNALYIVNPPNSGTLTTALPIQLNGAALDFGAVAGFDIEPVPSGRAFAALTVANVTSLYSIDLSTGVATSADGIVVYPIGDGKTPLAGMTVAQTTIVK